jgi:predicted alpha/beta hydrolase family esterase
MKRVLILHGTGGNSGSNWFPWLRKELEARGLKVWVPDLPMADRPSITRYNDFILKNKEWKFDEESVLVGHSSGAVAILGLLQELPENKKVDTCILVGAFKDNLNWEALDELFEKPFDFEKIKNKARRFVFIHSDNDPYCPLEHAKHLSNKLEGKLIVKKEQGHFNLEVGEQYREFPLILEIMGL